MKPFRVAAVALVSGLLFGAGLMVSGMASPARVLGFLTIDRNWDPTLMFVMGGAILIALPGFQWLARRPAPLLAESFVCPDTSVIDRKLIGGAALFGFGWGLTGYCPGPAIVGAGLGQYEALVLLAAMLTGGWIAGLRSYRGPVAR